MMTEREHNKSSSEEELQGSEVRCSECGRRLRAVKDQLRSEDLILCTFCYQNMLSSHAGGDGMEMLD